jgi:FkbM family methyltransferase
MAKTKERLWRFMIEHPKLYKFYENRLIKRRLEKYYNLRKEIAEKNIETIPIDDNIFIKIHPNSNQDLDYFENYLYKKIYEEKSLFFMKKLFPYVSTFIDVGANNGYFSLIASKYIKSNGQIYSFEPYPPSYKKLIENIEFNKLSNIKAFNLALSDQDGEIKFFINSFSDGWNSLMRYNKEFKDSIQVKVKKLDTIFRDEIIDVMKIDVEGYEEEVMEGSEKLIERSQNIVLFFEYAIDFLAKRKKDLDCTINFLKDRKFEVYYITKDKQLKNVQTHKQIPETSTDLMATRHIPKMFEEFLVP